MAEIRKSLWLDKPNKQPSVVRQSQTIVGRLIGPHPTEAGYALVDVGGDNPVNIRMSEGSIGWVGAPVTVATTPDGMPMSGTITAGETVPEDADRISFGPTGDAVLAGEKAQARTDGTLERLNADLAEASEKLAVAEQKLSEVATSTPVALQELREAQAAIKAQADAAVEQAQAAVQSAVQAAGIAEGKGETIISATEPDASKRKANNVWIKPGESAGTMQTYIWSETQAAWVAVDDDSIQQAAQNALDAMNKASAAEDKAQQASTAAARAQATASQAQSAATGAMVEAKNAPRIAVGHSRSYAQGKLQPPYREGDTLIIGDGSPVQVSETWVYESGGWRRHLLTADNLVVNRALWAKLVQADAGEIKDLIVTNEATVKDIIVTGKTTLRELIAELIKGKRIEGIEIVGGSYESTSGRVKVNDTLMSVSSSDTPTKGFARLRLDVRDKRDEMPYDPHRAHTLVDVTPTLEFGVEQLGTAEHDEVDFSLSEVQRYKREGGIDYWLALHWWGESARTLLLEAGPLESGEANMYMHGVHIPTYQGTEYGPRAVYVPSYTGTGTVTAGKPAKVDLSSVSPSDWETEVIYKLPPGSLSGGAWSSYDIENVPLPPDGCKWLWEAVVQQGTGIVVDWIDIPADGGTGIIHINNAGRYPHTLGATILRRTLIKEQS